MIGRQSVAMLRLLCLDDWVATDTDGYVARAIEKARTIASSHDLRRGIRRRMANSPLCDAPKFVRDLEAAYHDIWACRIAVSNRGDAAID